MSTKQLKTKAVTSLSNIIARLEYLIDSLKKGYLAVTTPGKAIILQPQGAIRFDLRAAVKPQKAGSSHQLTVKMKWERKSDAWRNVIRIPGQKNIPGNDPALPTPDSPVGEALPAAVLADQITTASMTSAVVKPAASRKAKTKSRVRKVDPAGGSKTRPAGQKKSRSFRALK